MTAPFPTVAPSSLSVNARRLVAANPLFDGIEDAMSQWGSYVSYTAEKRDAAKTEADKAKYDIRMWKRRTQMLAKTTATTQMYANATLNDPSAPPQAKAAARTTLAFRKQVLEAVTKSNMATTLEAVKAAREEGEEAKWRMLTASQYMMFGNDTIKTIANPPPTTKPLGACPAETVRYDANRGTPRQRKLLDYLTQKGLELITHLHATRPAEEPTKKLVDSWNRQVVALSETSDLTSGVMGSFQYKTGCLGVAFDSFSSLPRMLTRLIHELTHGAAPVGSSHGPDFYAIYRKYMRIATEELGWTLEGTCRETCFGEKFEKGYDPKKACPKCVWQQDPATCGNKAKPSLCEPKEEDRERLLLKYNTPEMKAYLGLGSSRTTPRTTTTKNKA